MIIRRRASEFDQRIAVIAGNAEVIRNITVLARHLLGNQRGVVVGRQAGSDLFPDAGLKIVLTASDRIRMRRKISQMVIELDVIKTIDEVESSEPGNHWNHDSRSIYIDTSNLNPENVLDRVSSHIVSELKWPKSAETGIAYGATRI